MRYADKTGRSEWLSLFVDYSTGVTAVLHLAIDM